MGRGSASVSVGHNAHMPTTFDLGELLDPALQVTASLRDIDSKQ
jgi:hypothetical protein